MKTIDTGKNTKKCETCKWLVLMSFCDGQTVDPSRRMCHYNWKECKSVRKEECHYKSKKPEVPRNE